MTTEIDTLKAQGRALGAYLKLQEGFALQHSRCLDAIAAMHGFSDWKEAAFALDRNQGELAELAPSLPAQAMRLNAHFEATFGFSLGDASDAVADIRWGALVETLNDAAKDALSIRAWLMSPRDEFGGRCAHELIETDAGYELIHRALFQLPGV